MNTDALTKLTDKWPNEYISIDNNDPASMLAAVTQESFYAQNLVIDQQVATAVSTFAAQNQFTYKTSPAVFKPVSTNIQAVPVWQKRMHASYGAITNHRIRGNIQGFEFSMQLLYTGFGEGNYSSRGILSPNNGPHAQGNAEIAYKAGVIRVKLSKMFPQIVLDSRKNDRRFMVSLDAGIKAGQTIQLEGDFNNHFDLYVPVGLQIDALSVLAPNFMQILKESSYNFDVEFFGDEMVLLTRDPLYTEKVMQVASRALDAQLTYLKRLLPSWNYEPQLQPFDLLDVSSASVSSLRIGRFKLGPLATTTIIFAIIAVILIFT
jgi:hypothetical protein